MSNNKIGVIKPITNELGFKVKCDKTLSEYLEYLKEENLYDNLALRNAQYETRVMKLCTELDLKVQSVDYCNYKVADPVENKEIDPNTVRISNGLLNPTLGDFSTSQMYLGYEKSNVSDIYSFKKSNTDFLLLVRFRSFVENNFPYKSSGAVVQIETVDLFNHNTYALIHVKEDKISVSVLPMGEDHRYHMNIANRHLGIDNDGQELNVRNLLKVFSVLKNKEDNVYQVNSSLYVITQDNMINQVDIGYKLQILCEYADDTYHKLSDDTCAYTMYNTDDSAGSFPKRMRVSTESISNIHLYLNSIIRDAIAIVNPWYFPYVKRTRVNSVVNIGDTGNKQTYFVGKDRVFYKPANYFSNCNKELHLTDVIGGTEQFKDKVLVYGDKAAFIKIDGELIFTTNKIIDLYLNMNKEVKNCVFKGYAYCKYLLNTNTNNVVMDYDARADMLTKLNRAGVAVNLVKGSLSNLAADYHLVNTNKEYHNSQLIDYLKKALVVGLIKRKQYYPGICNVQIGYFAKNFVDFLRIITDSYDVSKLMDLEILYDQTEFTKYFEILRDVQEPDMYFASELFMSKDVLDADKEYKAYRLALVDIIEGKSDKSLPLTVREFEKILDTYGDLDSVERLIIMKKAQGLLHP